MQESQAPCEVETTFSLGAGGKKGVQPPAAMQPAGSFEGGPPGHVGPSILPPHLGVQKGCAVLLASVI